MRGKMEIMHVIIIDPNLVDFSGHHFEYNFSIAKAAQRKGDQVTVLGHQHIDTEIRDQLQVLPSFRMTIWDGFQRYPRYHPFIRSLVSNFSFLFDLLKGLRSIHSKQHSIQIFHTLTRHQLLGCALYSLFFQPKNARAVFFLRYQPQFYEGRQGSLIFWLFQMARRRSNFDFYTDSEILADDFVELLNVVTLVAPIPHSHPGHSDWVPNSKKMRLVSLGNAREEKGILDLFSAIDEFALGQNSGIEFVLQINSPDDQIKPMLEAFIKKSHPNVQLIDHALNSADYLALLQSADIVLLPYWNTVYKGRTSGPFLEALSAGKPVITSKGTWMSQELKKYGAGILCESKNPEDLAQAIGEACSNLPELKARAIADRPKVLAFHNSDRFLQELIAPKKKDKLLILYPWGDLKDKKSGASLQVYLQCEYLKNFYDEVHVIQEEAKLSYQEENVYVERYQQKSLFLKFLKKSFTFFSMLYFGRKSRSEVRYLWGYLQSRLDRRYRAKIKHAAQDASAIILHYSFGVATVAPIARKLKIPIFVMQHDVISNMITSSETLKNFCFKAEISALKLAPVVGCLTPGDQEHFLKYGIHAEYFPGVIRAPDFGTNQDSSQTRSKLKLKFGISPGSLICLFVGSGHFPNVGAAKNIVAISDQFKTDPPFFVVAGNCMEPGPFINGIALGQVDDETLVDLYQAASLIVIPLESGTGISIKTIEAMAYGKVILGTGKAFRGIGFIPGVHGIQCDHLEEFPGRIRGLLASQAECVALGREASVLARAHESSVVFKKILPYLNKKPEILRN